MTDYVAYYTTSDGRIVDAIPMADETHSAEASDEYRIVVIDGETVYDRGTTRGAANSQDEVNRIGVTVNKNSPDLMMVIHISSPDASRNKVVRCSSPRW